MQYWLISVGIGVVLGKLTYAFLNVGKREHNIEDLETSLFWVTLAVLLCLTGIFT